MSRASRRLPTGRALVIAGVGALAIVALAPPFAAGAIVAWTLGLALAAYLDAGRARDSFELERRIPARVPQGDPLDVEWTARGRRGTARLLVAETFPETFDVESRETVMRVAADGIDRRQTEAVARRRGTWKIGPTRTRALGPAGLGWYESTSVGPVEVRVDPSIEPLRRLSLDRRRTRLLGGHRRRLRGVGSEFESLRDYRTDDDSRWVDWKATARRRRLTSREYQVEEHQSVLFAIDTGRLMATERGDRTKLDHALGAVLAIGWAAMARGDNLGAIAFDRTIRAELKPGRGRAQSVRFHEMLSRLQPSLQEPDWAAAFGRLGRRVHKRSLILVFTDLVDENVSEALIDALAHATRRHLVLVVTLTDVALLSRVAAPPDRPADAYRNAVAADALLLRDAAIKRLVAAGVRVVDSPADRLAADSVEAYLRLRAENRI
ncbi:MAG: DUF58 domain-containing protein [bacterium]